MGSINENGFTKNHPAQPERMGRSHTLWLMLILKLFLPKEINICLEQQMLILLWKA
jgi:hypothetical protein